MELAQSSKRVTGTCTCAIDTCQAWTRTPVDFPQEQIRTVGTLVEDPYVEPTYTEYRPDGTDYWSANAPIAPDYYPYNRCTVQQCTVCGRACLAYIEGGGYYVESRIRTLAAELLVDARFID